MELENFTNNPRASAISSKQSTNANCPLLPQFNKNNFDETFAIHES